MKPWNKLRREVAGAWRSFRYDLDHRAKAGVESKSRLWPIFNLRGQTGQTDQTRPFDPEATAVLGEVRPERESIWSPLHHPRRLMATMAVVTGVAASATGTFFAVSGGLGMLLVDSHSTPEVPPTVPASAPQAVVSATPGHRPVSPSRRPSPSASASATPSATASVRVSPAPARSAAPATPSPSGTVTTTTPSASPTPDGTPSATASHDPSPSATPTASAAP